MIKSVINKRIIQYGNEAQIIQYTTPHYIHDTQNRSNTRSYQEERRSDSLLRTRHELYRLIHCNIHQHGNYPPIFLTLTYQQNQTNLQQANKDYSLFTKKLSYTIGHKIVYIAIPEFQKRGAVHYHAMLFNFPRLKPKQIQAIWGHGTIRVELPKNIDNLAAYMAKYLSKDILDKRLKGHRLLLTSKGLQRPQIYDNSDITDFQKKFRIINQKSNIQTERKNITTVTIQKYANPKKD